MQFPRATHPLLEAADKGVVVVAIEPLWSGYSIAAESLSKHAVKAKYPGATRLRDEAKQAVNYCREFSSLVRRSLGLKV